MTEKPRFIAVTGPTATGKTQLSLSIARELPCEIISMDSRQVYRGMDIGTDKVSPDVRALVPHHGLDLIDPGERYSAGKFARDARRWMEEIRARGRMPLLVGGTGFFLKAVMHPLFDEPSLDPARQERLRAWMRDQPREALERYVRALDPARAPIAVEGGPQRMGRAIEVALLSGRRLSWWHSSAPPIEPGVPGVVIVLDLPPEVSDERIEDRVQSMVDRGLVSEVQALLDAGYTDGDPGMTGTGYREIARHLRGESTLAEAMDAIRVATRRYARRQRTWWRHQVGSEAIRLDASLPIDAQRARVMAAASEAGMP